MLVLIKAETEFDVLDKACAKWAQLRHQFENECELLVLVLSCAFKVSLLMAGKCKMEPQGLDLSKSMNLFFEKKSAKTSKG